MSDLQASLQLDLPFLCASGDLEAGGEDSSWEFDDPLAREVQIMPRRVVNPEEGFRIVLVDRIYIKAHRETKAEKRKRRALLGSPRQLPRPLPEQLAPPQTSVATKTPYSVFEDMVILTTFKSSQLAHLSLNEKIDLVMEDLPHRSFESLRERMRRWLTELSDEDHDKIIKYCDDEYEICEHMMVKRMWVSTQALKEQQAKEPEVKPVKELSNQNKAEGKEIKKGKSEKGAKKIKPEKGKSGKWIIEDFVKIPNKSKQKAEEKLDGDLTAKIGKKTPNLPPLIDHLAVKDPLLNSNNHEGKNNPLQQNLLDDLKVLLDTEEKTALISSHDSSTKPSSLEEKASGKSPSKAVDESYRLSQSPGKPFKKLETKIELYAAPFPKSYLKEPKKPKEKKPRSRKRKSVQEKLEKQAIALKLPNLDFIKPSLTKNPEKDAIKLPENKNEPGISTELNEGDKKSLNIEGPTDLKENKDVAITQESQPISVKKPPLSKPIGKISQAVSTSNHPAGEILEPLPPAEPPLKPSIKKRPPEKASLHTKEILQAIHSQGFPQVSLWEVIEFIDEHKKLTIQEVTDRICGAMERAGRAHTARGGVVAGRKPPASTKNISFRKGAPQKSDIPSAGPLVRPSAPRSARKTLPK